MIIIFSDGSTNIGLRYIGVAIAGFRVENNIIKECLFVEKSQLSGAYCQFSIHEAFALKKALEKISHYPGEEIIIINDQQSTIDFANRIKKGDISLKKNKYDKVVHHILNNNFKDILNKNVKFECLSRKSYGIQIVDMLSKAYITRDDIMLEAYQNFINEFKEKSYNLLSSEFPSVFIENKTHYLKRKPKKITLKLHFTQLNFETKKADKVHKCHINASYLRLHPELKEPPPKLKFTFN